MLTDITSNVNSWSNKAGFVSGMIANDTQNGKVYAVPWFGGVRGVWYRKDQFAGAGISAPPTSWAQLLADANALMKKYPGTYGLGASRANGQAAAEILGLVNDSRRPARSGP